MSLLHNEDFTIWQLRSSYLTTIKDGIGDRLINVNNSVLNTPGFRAAGWSTVTNNNNASSASSLKRTYSPPIPTTAAVSSEYYRLAVRDANAARDELHGLGLEDGEEDEGGMVTGKSTMDITARKNQDRAAKKKLRRERQQEVQRHAAAEDDDSSDLSDSDDDGDNLRRSTDQIDFPKMPIRRDRSDSSPMRSGEQGDRPEPLITSTATQNVANHYRSGSLGTSIKNQGRRPRRDTATSSELSTDNEVDTQGHRPGQVQFSTTNEVMERPRRRRERTGSRGAESLALEDLQEQDEDSGAESVGSALSSEFDATAGSGSLLLAGVGISGGLDSSSPVALMHKLPTGNGPQGKLGPEVEDHLDSRTTGPSTPAAHQHRTTSRTRAPSNPVEKFMVLSGLGQQDPLWVKIFLPLSSNPGLPMDMPLMRESKLSDHPAHISVAEVIGLALWTYSEQSRAPPLEREKLTVNRWALRMVDDGEVEYDFPALGRTLPMTDFTSNNNQAAKSRARSRGRPWDEFALVEASQSEFEENERLYPQYSQSIEPEESESPAQIGVAGAQPVPQINLPTERQNPILGPTFKSAIHDNTLTPADRPAVPISHATPRLGITKTLKIRFLNLEGSAHVMTLNTTTDSYIAEILDSVCKRWGLDKGNYLLKVMGSNTVALLDRTVEALGNVTELDLVRRRFGAGPLSLGGSPGSLSPNTPLQPDGTGPNPSAVKKGKKGNHMLPSSSQKQDLIGGYYRRYHVYRKQPMSFTASNHRILTFDNDYMHIVPGETGKNASDSKTRSINFNDVVGCKVSRRHPKSFRVVVLRGNEANEQKRYDFEARNALEAVEIVDEIKKNMAQYRV
ncbi:hypothetical protein N7454_007722 [Penicillium verhagenii]|nr:hypothetical protein N7454_007722 [Penicillium verhagenii]